MPGVSVLTIGHFDGVHRGHRAILTRARQAAREHGAQVVAMTFDPHPATVLRPGSQPPRLSTVERKIERLKQAGADEVVILKPTRELLGQTPEQFVAAVVARHRPVAIVEGADFRFGRQRSGDMRKLAALGRSFRFQAIVQPAVEIGLSDMLVAPVSSSLIRWLVGRGRMVDAAMCLGEHYALGGRVVEGERQGRKLGVPTANLDPRAYAQQLPPMDGVYAGYAQVAGRAHLAAISVGVKPTFGVGELTIEAHLLEFEDDIYGQMMEIRFARWLRDQYAFADIADLQWQLQRDIARTRRLHADGALAAGEPRYEGFGSAACGGGSC